MANLRVDKITSTETFETTGSVQFIDEDRLVIAANSDFDFGTGDFTVEWWQYLNGPQNEYQTVLSINYGTNPNLAIQSATTTGTAQKVYVNGTSVTFTEESDGPISTWVHYALVRNGSGSNNLKIYRDGVQTGQGTYTGDIGSSSSTNYIGGFYTASTLDLKGFISNFRIVKGTALYTANFKPPMRELENIPGTVLLCCQSKTDATLEKTGKTITVTGPAVASEFTPGLLTPVPKAGAGSAITGSVEFDGTGDYLTLANSSDLAFGTGDFTLDCWIYANETPSDDGIFESRDGSVGATNGFTLTAFSSSVIRIYSGSALISSSETYTNQWNHIAVTRYSGTLNLFINGISQGTSTASLNMTNQDCIIGGGRYAGDSSVGANFKGFISNFRLVKGTALYTDDFIPPTRELKKVPGTVLLCCQDEDSVTTEAIGKTITSYGDPAASNFTPQVGDDRKVTLEGVTKVNSDAYFYLPTGDTITRDSRRGRGVQGAGYYYVSPAQTYVNTISYYEISTTGNALDFGDLKDTKGQIGCLGSATRGVFAGASQPDVGNAMDYITIASTGNALEFGDMTDTKWASGGVANSTRGLFAGGRQPGWRASIDFITIASTGNAADFGDLSNGEQNHEMAAASSPTRGVFAGGSAPGSSPYFTNKIDFVTIQSTGNAQDFGDLSSVRKSCTGVASQTRMCIGGGLTPGLDLSIEYLTISSKGNSQTFGDLTGSEGRWGAGGTSNSIRGVFGGGYDPSPAASYNTMDYITIASTGDAQDFGDIGGANGINIAPGLSNAHGGLG